MRTILVFLCLMSLLGCKDSKEQHNDTETTSSVVTTYYLIRHAEKDRTDPENKDPELTEQGELRALHWADYFKDIPLDAVHSSDYNRTLQTARPTASSKQLALKLYEPGKLYGTKFLENTKGQKLLIVGHSNTIPSLVNQLIQQNTYADLDDNDNASLFVVIMDANGTRVEQKSIKLP